MRFQSFQSGSGGNAVYIGTGSAHVLVDAGISCKRITEGLGLLGITPKELDGVLVTHEHTDHISGLFILAKKYGVPIYGTAGTLSAVREADRAGCIDPGLYREITAGSTFPVGALTVSTVNISHDARDPVAYRVTDGKKTAAVMTDLGTYTEDTVAFLQGVNGLLIESNHDIRMLEAGPYPYVLKRRILGDFGHLSNEKSGELLDRVLHPEMDFVFLGHMSEENNYPETALMTVTQAIDLSDSVYASHDFDIRTASRYHAEDVMEF